MALSALGMLYEPHAIVLFGIVLALGDVAVADYNIHIAPIEIEPLSGCLSHHANSPCQLTMQTN